MSQNNRIAYYDVMKGILICLVMFSHVNYETLYHSGIPNTTFQFLSNQQRWFMPFFMPAFFVVTGICSNFNKPFKPFLVNNAKMLLVPGIAFDLLFYTLPRILTDYGVCNELFSFTRRIFWMGGIHWFLPSLFAAKIIYWILNKHIQKSYIRWFLLFVLLVFGFLTNNYGVFPRKWWNMPQVCDLTIFLGIGQFFKGTTINKDKLQKTCCAIFTLIIISSYLLHFKVPYVTAGYRVGTWFQLFLHLIAATTGSFAMHYLCQKIDHNTFFEYLGKGSLVIYLVHSYVIQFLLSHGVGSLVSNASIFPSICLFIAIFIIISIVSCGVFWLCGKKYFKALVGKW